MAKYLGCDVCGKLSPNEKGEYIANRWSLIAVRSSFDAPREREYNICDTCIGHGIVLTNKGVKHVA